MPDRRHSNSVVEEGGRNTSCIWSEDGQRRQAEPLARLRRPSAYPAGRSAGVSYLPGHLSVPVNLGSRCRGVTQWMSKLSMMNYFITLG